MAVQALDVCIAVLKAKEMPRSHGASSAPRPADAEAPNREYSARIRDLALQVRREPLVRFGAPCSSANPGLNGPECCDMRRRLSQHSNISRSG